jgi:hypothetical protein
MARVQDEELEEEEERDPNHAISALYTTRETDARKAEKPTNNTPSKSAAWDTVRRLTSRGVEHFLALLSAVLAHLYLRVHETSPGVHCNTPLRLNRGKGLAGVTTAFITHDVVHQTHKRQTPYITGTVALQAGARVDKVGASATLRSLGRDRGGPNAQG